MLELGPKPCLDDFDVGSSVGRGNFGEIFMATHKATKQEYALKVIKKD